MISEQTRKKLSLSKMGNKNPRFGKGANPTSFRKGQHASFETEFKKGQLPSNYKGENAGYYAKHDWVYRQKGKAIFCSFDIAHKSHHFEWANVSGAYWRDVNDYVSLCVKCHRQYDIVRKAGGNYAIA